MSKSKVLIFGSCVSRDALEFDKNDSFELVGHFARSSFASLTSKPCVDEDILKSLESKFQRQMVLQDMQKNFFSFVRNNDFDILLVDLIEERFHLVLNEDGSMLTYSAEYKTAQKNNVKLLNRYHEKKFNLWFRGFLRLINILKELNKLEKIYINKVFWCNNLNLISQDYLEQSNAFLSKMYEKIEQYIPKSQFITYDNNLFFCDPNHKWGGAPYHYCDELYQSTIEQLKKIK
ncbi:DUF6270 domain-containing protein [Campylobacter hyointestinalis]|uniref:DUF6270 domain-containing protein n=1 Tax=Campylobacter hyointestinalis TaxID=198 RepID=UPI000DCE1F97|nr:DUF6270 domain-containing protein [Campylobacter hyointestinalis]RAZ53399.1 hypothetical protein CHL10074_09370 [Campylobacter hyointestinalis subsp. lawsonii]RAZ62218.1 hypothetical protein CHL9767_09010 [Campylobacter hyointestinalis subsp. lawsonii]